MSKNEQNGKQGLITDVVFIVAVLLLVITFGGEPDLMDAIMQRLTR